MSRSLFGNLVPGARKTKRTSFELVAAWLGAARLAGSPQIELLNRQHHRWRWERPVLLWLDGERFPVQAYDLSKGGAGLNSPRRLEIDSVIEISAVDDTRGETRVAARVVYVNEPAESGFFPTGVAFADLMSGTGKN